MTYLKVNMIGTLIRERALIGGNMVFVKKPEQKAN